MNIFLIAKAFKLSMKAHSGQFRFDGQTPYFSHILDTVNNLDTEDEDIVIAAYLHDILEDTPTTIDDLRAEGFSEASIQAVLTLTKLEGQDYQSYLDNVKSNPIARAVKIADMTANLNDTPTKNQVKKYTNGLKFLTAN